MSCTRCQGLMLEERMIDMEAGYGEMWSYSGRCFNCGHRDDAVIQHHRQLPTTPVVVISQPLSLQTSELAWEAQSESTAPLAV